MNLCFICREEMRNACEAWEVSDELKVMDELLLYCQCWGGTANLSNSFSFQFEEFKGTKAKQCFIGSAATTEDSALCTSPVWSWLLASHKIHIILSLFRGLRAVKYWAEFSFVA